MRGREQKFDNSGNGRRLFEAGNLRKDLLKNSLGQLLQGLKPQLFCCTYGPTKVVPLLRSPLHLRPD